MSNNFKKIFVADDDIDILSIIQIILELEGYEVHATVNAIDIFNYEKKFPDLIILDIWMGKVDGRKICGQLKKHNLMKDIPVMFISANADIKEMKELYNAQEYISKPFEMRKLLDKVNAILLN